MTERIDQLQYDRAISGTVAPTNTQNFYDGPGEFLCRQVVDALKADTTWAKIFGEYVDPYLREDYSQRALPALRIYSEGSRKEYESWFIEGDLKADIILPASIRRPETQQIPDTLCAALLQQFRRPEFFNALCELTPGLNELGKRFSTDKTLGFKFEETVVPLIQITVNFKIDLREWDQYLEETNRTKDSPFEEVLGDLTSIASVLQGLRDSQDKEVELPSTQEPGEPAKPL